MNLLLRITRWFTYRSLGAIRSSEWSSIRKYHLQDYPNCTVCDTDKNIEVHHIIPFHKEPALELRLTNLITLCTQHHFLFGHLLNWSSWNDKVEQQAQEFNNQIKNRPCLK